MGFCDSCGNVARLIILGLTAAGIVLQSWAAYDCEFLKFNANGSSGTLGLFRWYLPDANMATCTDADYEDTKDPMLTAARAMCVMAICFAFCGGALVAFEWLLCKIPCAGCVEGLMYSGAKMCTCLVYLAYGSTLCIDANFSCTFGQGASYNISALACYFAAGLVLCCSPKPDPIFKQCS